MKNYKRIASKAVILARVSSKEQEDGKSLDAQLDICRKYAFREGLQILKEYEIVESSTKGARKKFSEMLSFALSQNEPIAILSHTVDRFQRRFDESVIVEPYIEAGKLELHFINSGLVVTRNNLHDNSLVWDVSVLGARAYINNIKINTRRGLNKKIADGEFPGKAPAGYKNVRLNNKNTIVIDKDMAPIIRSFFEKYATGNYSVDKAAEDFRKAGIMSCRSKYFTESSMYRILTNPFYYGYMRVKNNITPHIYPPLISKELFDKCQAVRTGYHKQHLNYGSKEFAFKNVLKCACCGLHISSYDRIKKNKGNGNIHHYTYLRCAGRANKKRGYNCNSKNIREEVAIEQVIEKLKAIQIPQELLQASLKRLNENMQNEIEKHKSEQANVKRRLTEISRQKEVWVAKEAAGLLASHVVNSNLKKLQEEEDYLKTMVDEDGKKETSISVWTLSRLLNLVSRLPELFSGSQPEQKRKILKLVFANLSLREKNIEIVYKKPFQLLLEGANNCVWGG